MKRMKSEYDMAFLYITHDLATAHYIAEETAVMYKGQIVEWGDTNEVINNPPVSLYQAINFCSAGSGN